MTTCTHHLIFVCYYLGCETDFEYLATGSRYVDSAADCPLREAKLGLPACDPIRIVAGEQPCWRRG